VPPVETGRFFAKPTEFSKTPNCPLLALSEPQL